MPSILLFILSLILGLLTAGFVSATIFSLQDNRIKSVVFINLLFSAFFGVLCIGSGFWLSTDRQESEEYFFKIFEDTHTGKRIKCIRRDMTLENMNSRFDCIIEDGSFVRIYKFEEWKNGILFAPRFFEYELIDPSHKRYEEVKKKFD